MLCSYALRALRWRPMLAAVAVCTIAPRIEKWIPAFATSCPSAVPVYSRHCLHGAAWRTGGFNGSKRIVVNSDRAATVGWTNHLRMMAAGAVQA